jgi:DNA-binding GntR family transcriptional regulator
MAMSKGPASPRRQRSYHEHMAIIEAIEQDRPDEAERLVRQHIEDGLQYVRERIEAGEADLSWLV